jgi:hypothetical protein|tara:strand:- start:16 stop:207 length:192 start_codon:yes stop_codon:yes gene_type:complete
MKNILLIITFLVLVLSGSIKAKEVKCKSYDLPCKAKKFATETKNYQKKEWKKAGEKFKRNKGQ